jgi:hypothetical protein
MYKNVQHGTNVIVTNVNGNQVAYRVLGIGTITKVPVQYFKQNFKQEGQV